MKHSRGVRLVNVVRLLRAALLLLTLGVLGWPLDRAQSVTFPPQGGSPQMPTRYCLLYNFADPKIPKGDASTPNQIGTMVQGPAGDDNFYSTSPAGGAHNQGTIFKVTPDGKTETILYSFAGGVNGATPRGGLALGPGPDGDLYGTTSSGGKYAAGTIFRISRGGGDYEVIFDFRNGKVVPAPPAGTQPSEQQLMDAAGSYPSTAPVLGKDGYLYGVTGYANNTGTGTLYRISTGRDFKCLHLFKSTEAATNGQFPASLSVGQNGDLFGTTWAGGLKTGTVFEFTPSTGIFYTLHRFNNAGLNPSEMEGGQSYGVIQGADRTLYGTTSNGGPSGRGVVFSLTLGGSYKVLHGFGGNASNPLAALVEVPVRGLVAGETSLPATYLYGVSSLNYSVASRFDSGIVFRIAPDGTDFSVVYNFDGATGAAPAVAPVLARDSNLYGLASGGGSATVGVFYRLNTSYLATGVAETDTPKVPSSTPPPQRLVFQGSPQGKTWIYNDPMVQVATYMTGFLPAYIAKQHVDGITVRAKDSATQFVQFFYREWITDAKGTHYAGPANQVSDWQGQYDASTTYTKAQQVYYTDSSGKFGEWLSIANGNKGNVPPASPKFWAAATIAGCTSAIHSCYPLTVDPMHPMWVPDAELPSAIYLPADTESGCDGNTLYDSPNFNNFPNVTEVFTAMDYLIVDKKVVKTVTWRIQKVPGQPLQYTAVAFGAPPSDKTLQVFRDLLTSKGFDKTTLPF